MPSISPSLARLCRCIRYGAVFFVTAVIAIYLVAWIAPDITHHRHPVLHLAGLSGTLLASFTLEQRALIASMSIPYLAVLVWAFYRLVRMLRDCPPWPVKVATSGAQRGSRQLPASVSRVSRLSKTSRIPLSHSNVLRRGRKPW